MGNWINSISSKLLWGVYGIFTFFTFLLWFCRFIPTDVFWMSGAATVFLNAFIFGHLGFTLVWFFFRPKRFWIPLLFFFIFARQADWGMVLPQSQAESKSFSIGLMNYGNFQGSRESARKEGIRTLLLEEMNADVMIINEARFTETKSFSSIHLLKRLGYRFFNMVPFKKGRRIQMGIAIISKFPITHVRQIPIQPSGEHSTNSAFECMLTVQEKNIRIIGFHLRSNGVSPSNIQENEGVEMLREVKSSFLQRYKPAEKIRATQAQILREAIHSKDIPTVVLGDFNDPPGSYVYHTIKKNYSNAFSTHAWGPGATYSGPIPFLRIDNILFSSHLQATKYRTIPSKISDHHPIMATLQWD